MIKFDIVNKARLGLYILSGLILAVAVIFFVIGSLRPKVAGIYVETSPPSTVWINSKQSGRTKFKDTLKPGETSIRLIPDSFEVPLSPYETKVDLVAGVETVIKYDFGDVDENAAGEVVSFEKNAGGETSLVVVSDPDSVEVLIDRREKAITPHKTSSILPGEHELLFKKDGYKDRVVRVKTHEGYKLTAVVKLARSQEQKPQEDPNKTEENSVQKDQVEILSTPTGYLRVRAEASSSSDEIGRVNPGQKYNLLEREPKAGWYKIEFESEKEGWISAQYAKRILADISVSPMPSASLTPTKAASPAAATKTVTPTP